MKGRFVLNGHLWGASRAVASGHLCNTTPGRDSHPGVTVRPGEAARKKGVGPGCLLLATETYATTPRRCAGVPRPPLETGEDRRVNCVYTSQSAAMRLTDRADRRRERGLFRSDHTNTLTASRSRSGSFRETFREGKTVDVTREESIPDRR